jgi:hypothetical protein
MYNSWIKLKGKATRHKGNEATRHKVKPGTRNLKLETKSFGF